MRDRGLRYWLPTYLWEALRRQRARVARRRGLTHILFLVCDHFEPRHGVSDESRPAARLRAWHAGFGDLQKECFARYGLRPLHTWFYPPHHGYEHLAPLGRMAFDGLGEVELHYHHQGDTRESLRAALREVLARYHRAGLLLQIGVPPGRRFGFIHGDWALANSAGGRFCGVDGELSLLHELGCWADLTMPSTNECQTRKINSIYYATGSEQQPKCHDWGDDACANRSGLQQLLLMQGPSGLSLQQGLRPRVENASLTRENWGRPERVLTWIDCHVHVRGRPEWLFVKLHTHGAIENDFDALFGERARRMHRTLAEQYNDGRSFRLHYVTARQAFNLARAAEAGALGDPEEFLDWEVPAQVTSLYWADAAHDALACTPQHLLIDNIRSAENVTMSFRHAAIVEISGRLQGLDLRPLEAAIRILPQVPYSPVRVRLAGGARVAACNGGSVIGQDADGTILIRADSGARLTLTFCNMTAVRAAP